MSKGKEINKSLDSLVSEFFLKLSGQLAGWLYLGELYVKIIREHPQQGKERIIAAAAENGVPISRQLLNGLEKVGLHEMNFNLLPGLSTENSAGIKKLVKSDQDDIFSGKKYPLLLENGDNVMVDIRKISRHQVEQIIGDGCIRDLAEQKTFIAEHGRPEDQPKEVKDPWRIIKLKNKKGLQVGAIFIPEEKLREILIMM